jgi:hypothetical protein
MDNYAKMEKKLFGGLYIMGHIMKFCLASLVFVFFSITALPSVQAASQATMQVNAAISNSSFWDYTFIKETIPSKPSTVKVEWSLGNNGSNPKNATIISAGKTSGQVAIVSAKGELVNLSICVRNAKNEILGKWGMQVTNKGQTESVTISLPETVEPLFNTN